jgi:uncharacterized protein YbcV (DUF1398 family)
MEDLLELTAIKAKEMKIIFTLEQINRVHDQLGKAATLPQYLQALKDIGVDKCDSFVTDGHSEYSGKEGQRVISSSEHEEFKIAAISNREAFIKHLNLHSQGKTSYLDMSRGLADSGIEKWTFDTNKMTMTYYDKAGNVMLLEEIK